MPPLDDRLTSVAIIIAQLLKKPPRKLASGSEVSSSKPMPNDESRPAIGKERDGFAYAFHSASLILPSVGALSTSENVRGAGWVVKRWRERRSRTNSTLRGR